MEQPKPSLGSMLGPGAEGGIVSWSDNERLLSQPPPPPAPDPTPAVSASYPPVALAGNPYMLPVPQSALRRILGAGDRRRHFGVVASVGALLLIVAGWVGGDDAPLAATVAGMGEARGLDGALAAQRAAVAANTPAPARAADPRAGEAPQATAEDDRPDETDAKAGAAAGGDARKSDPQRDAKSDAKSDAKAAFDRDAVRNAVFGAAGSASACRVKGGPTGRAKATVTIAPSGRVVSVAVGGPFGGTKVGHCISRVFKSVRVPAFSGSPVTVSKTVTIR